MVTLSPAPGMPPGAPAQPVAALPQVVLAFQLPLATEAQFAASAFLFAANKLISTIVKIENVRIAYNVHLAMHAPHQEISKDYSLLFLLVLL